ncbi:hypothetical protein DFH06DRAFT_1418561 [Mycena polygramma]|nr:hypothetical protein DFH06DRAFT_1418561 [Mycena polygramma]
MRLECCTACGSLNLRENNTGASSNNLPPNALDDALMSPPGNTLAETMTMIEAELARLVDQRSRLSGLRQEIRSRLSPLRRVPSEVWSLIFTAHGHVCRAEPQPYLNRYFGMTVHFPLMLVCQKWHDLVISTPGIWAFIALDMGDASLPASTVQDAVDVHLLRSKQHPLDIVITAGISSRSAADVLKPYSPILERILGQSARIHSLSLDMSSCSFQVLPQHVGSFDQLASLSIRLCDHETDTTFWAQAVQAPLRSLALKRGTTPDGLVFPWDTIRSLETNNVELLLSRLNAREKSLTEVELDGPTYAFGLDRNKFEQVRNSNVRSLKVHCGNAYSDMLLCTVVLPDLEELAVLDCDHISWQEQIGPAVSRLLSSVTLQTLSLNVDLSNDAGLLTNIFQNSLPRLSTLHVKDFWTDGDMTPLTQEHESWFTFPLELLRHPYGKTTTLPALEVFTYRVFPERFSGVQSAGLPLGTLWEDVGFMKFLQELDHLLANRINCERRPGVTKLKSMVLHGGGRNLDDFPAFTRRIDEYHGFVFDFDETDEELQWRRKIMHACV